MDIDEGYAMIPLQNRSQTLGRLSTFQVVLTSLLMCPLTIASAQVKLPTVDEARAISQQTGRPIFAMAGRETWGGCQSLLKRLNTDRTLGAFAGQFVPVKLTTDGNAEWSKWSRRYPHQGQAIPIVFVIRADGEKIYARSGGLEGKALPQMLVSALRGAGRTFNDAETKLLAKAVPEAEQALQRDDLVGAAAALKPLQPLGKLGDFKSYSKLAIQADQIVQKVSASGEELLKEASALNDIEAPEDAASPEHFEHALTLVSAADAFTVFPELNATAAKTLRSAERNDAIAPLLTQARALIRARGYAKLESAKFQRSAIKAYEQILKRYPNGAVATLARKELGQLDPDSEMLGETPASQPNKSKPDAFRTWTDATGQFKTVAKLISVREGVVFLTRKDGRRLELPLAKLSAEDREFLKQLRLDSP